MQLDQPAGLEVSGDLALWEYTPSEPESDSHEELTVRWDVVDRRLVLHRGLPQVGVLEVVFGIEAQHRQPPQINLFLLEAFDQRWGADRPVHHRPEPLDRTAGGGCAGGRDRRHHASFSEQGSGMVLILDVEVEEE